MPFVSEAQRRWMHANDPEMAERWEEHTPKGKKLPRRVKTNRASKADLRDLSRAKRGKLVVNKVKAKGNYDPTRTQTLRTAFVKKLRAKFKLLSGELWKLIVMDDTFGLKGKPHKIEQVMNVSAEQIDAAAAEAQTPTDAQRESGNYKKGHVTIQGLGITIETTRGNKRKAYHDRPLSNHYGYIKRHVSGADGDHVDCFLGPHPESEVVFVVDQLSQVESQGGKIEEKFDEHKVMIGFLNAKEAKAAYLANYSDGWDGFGGIRALTMAQFKQWLEEGDTSQPIGGQQIVTFNTFNPDQPRNPDGTWSEGGSTQQLNMRVTYGTAEQRKTGTVELHKNFTRDQITDLMKKLDLDNISLKGMVDLDGNSYLWEIPRGSEGADHERMAHKLDLYVPHSQRFYIQDFDDDGVPKVLTKMGTESSHHVTSWASKHGMTANADFSFESTPEALAKFQEWLRKKYGKILLGQPDQKLWEQFAKDGFIRGAGRAFDDVNASTKATGAKSADFFDGGRDQFLRSSFGRPETVEKIQILASRSFMDLKNVTEDMATKMSRSLTDGLARGANPREIADDLDDVVNVGARRAEVIARTEIIRAHAEGQLDAFERMGVDELGVEVEWLTAGDDGRTCEECLGMEGKIFSVQEAHGMIPAHPQCRCAFIPANVGEKDKETRNQFVFNTFNPDQPRDDHGQWSGEHADKVEKHLYTSPLGLTPGVVARRVGLSKDLASAALEHLVSVGAASKNGNTYKYTPKNLRDKEHKIGHPLKEHETFDINSEYSARVSAVDKSSENLGGEKATTIVYKHKSTGETVGSAVLMKTEDGYVLGDHAIEAAHRGKGLGRQFISQLAKRVGRIESDPTHTEDAEKMWKSIPGAKKEHGVWSLTNKEES